MRRYEEAPPSLYGYRLRWRVAVETHAALATRRRTTAGEADMTLERPRFKPHLHVEVVPGEGAFVLSERPGSHS